MSDKMVKYDGSGKTVAVLKGVGIGAAGTVAVLTIGFWPLAIGGGAYLAWKAFKK